MRFRNCSQLPSDGIYDQQCSGEPIDHNQSIEIQLKFITQQYMDNEEDNYIQPVINSLNQNVFYSVENNFETVMDLNHLKIIRDSNLFYNDEQIGLESNSLIKAFNFENYF